MLLEFLDHPLLDPETVAVDENGVVWARRGPGWARGCLAYGTRHVFLRPAWAVCWPPLTLEAYEDILARTPS